MLNSADSIKQCARLVKRQVERGDQVVVVTSALSGITDRLLKVAKDLETAKRSDARAVIDQFCDRLLEDHISVAREVADPGAKEISSKLRSLVALLKTDLAHIAGKDASARTMDRIASMGERLSTPIFAAALSSLGVRAVDLTGGEAGIVTDSNFGDAMPKMDVCRTTIKSRLESLISEGITPVVTGFAAQDESGAITTLGRGGSDYTASILGACLGVDEIWIWKDVGGIMTANPKVVSEAKTIPFISYAEAAELAYFGAKVLHPRTMGPAMQAGISIRVKDATAPDRSGTLISNGTTQVPGAVKAVTSMDDVGLISVSGTGMVGLPGVAAKVFKSLARGKVNVMMISQSSSETNITIAVKLSDIPACRRILSSAFRGDAAVREIAFDEDVSIVSVVGSGMKGTPGVAARVFKAVADAGASVIMIAQGSSEMNISFLVRKQDSARVVLSIHREFRLHQLPDA